MGTVAVAIMCKTPLAGASKTRLAPPLQPDECALLSACFIRDLAATIESMTGDGDVAPYAVYTPVGTESTLRQLLPESFRLVPQHEGDFGDRLRHAIRDLLGAGHDGAILVNSDSPTLPRAILRQAVNRVREHDAVTLSPALDGGYTLIGLAKPHPRLFDDIPWSTADVYRLTVERARQIGLPVSTVGGWYDVDDADSLTILEEELAGRIPPLPGGAVAVGSLAVATRRFLRDRHEREHRPAAWGSA